MSAHHGKLRRTARPRVHAAAVLAVFAVVMSVNARDAAQLRADFAAIVPADMKVRMAWIKGGPTQEFAEETNSTVVYAVDSDDGIIRRLYPASGSGTYHAVNLTADGSKVVFYNGNADRICIINFDGSGFKEVDMGGSLAQCWRNPADNTDWAVIWADGLKKARIDAPTTSLTITQGSAWGYPNGTPTKWAMQISTNGNIIFMDGWDRDPNAYGVFNVTTNTFSWSNHWGCGASIGAGANPVFNHNPSGHWGMCLHDCANVNSFTTYRVADTIAAYLQRKGLSSSGGYTTEGTRFSNRPEFATVMMKGAKANPFLFQFPNFKIVHIEDDVPTTTYCGDAGAVFLPTTPVVRRNGRARVNDLARTGVRQTAYLPDGRRRGPNGFSERGGRADFAAVVIRSVAGRATVSVLCNNR